METQVVKQESAAVVAASPITPMQMLNMAVSQGADLDKLTKLMDLQERWEKNEARKAFVAALNAFKTNPPEVLKNKDVLHNGKFMYRHATLDNVSGIIGEALATVGISHRWETEQIDGIVRVTCVLTHDLGHSERVPLQAEPDKSGAKNSIQAIGSTVTYLQRYTLLAATGMAVKDQDNDAESEKPEGMPEGQKADFMVAIDSVTKEGFDDLWQKIIAATPNDANTRDEMRIAMSARKKALK